MSYVERFLFCLVVKKCCWCVVDGVCILLCYEVLWNLVEFL